MVCKPVWDEVCVQVRAACSDDGPLHAAAKSRSYLVYLLHLDLTRHIDVSRK